MSRLLNWGDRQHTDWGSLLPMWSTDDGGTRVVAEEMIAVFDDIAPDWPLRTAPVEFDQRGEQLQLVVFFAWGEQGADALDAVEGAIRSVEDDFGDWRDNAS